MTASEQRTAVIALCRAALLAAPSMPAAQRADVYDGISVACRFADSELAESAALASSAIRDAELRQMTFSSLLNSTAS